MGPFYKDCRFRIALLLPVFIIVIGCTHLRTEDHATPRIKPGAVIYGVVPPLFGDEPLRDVVSKLDYLKDLGVDIILLSPIQATDDPSSISYAVTDYFQVRPDFGDTEDLRRLVSEAHKRGLRVMMDFIPNHTSTGHPYYQDIQKKGTASPYYHFYDRDEQGVITHYFDWVGLPNLNFENPALLSEMRRALIHWHAVSGMDGYRVDAAWGIRERSPEAWPALISALRSESPQFIMLAEAGARDPFYNRNGFDLAYDWTDEPGKWAWKPAFENPEKAGQHLHQAITKNQDNPEHVLRFLNNNDTGERFITRYGRTATRTAAALQHTVPGVPLVYTGDEVGAEYEPYEDPPPISWQDAHGLRELYRKLALLREKLPAIRSGGFIPLPPENNPSAYAFLRVVDRKNWALVIVNFGRAGSVDLKIPESKVVDFEDGAVLRDQIDGNRIIAHLEAGKLRIGSSADAAMVLVPE